MVRHSGSVAIVAAGGAQPLASGRRQAIVSIARRDRLVGDGIPGLQIGGALGGAAGILLLAVGGQSKPPREGLEKGDDRGEKRSGAHCAAGVPAPRAGTFTK